MFVGMLDIVLSCWAAGKVATENYLNPGDGV